MLVEQILKQKDLVLIAIDTDAPVETAMHWMRQEQVGAIVALDKRGAYEGIIGEREVVAAISQHGAKGLQLPVRAVMATNVPAASPRESINAVMRIMTERRARHIPVISDGAVISVISVGDAVKYQLQETIDENGVLRDLARAHLLAA
jgi:CBS domain-containing protein